MNFIEALLLGLIQGVTEFLPVSSSGHLTLLGRVFAIDEAAMLSLATLLQRYPDFGFCGHATEIGAIYGIFCQKTWLLLVATVPAVGGSLLGDWIDGCSAAVRIFFRLAVIFCISLFGAVKRSG